MDEISESSLMLGFDWASRSPNKRSLGVYPENGFAFGVVLSSDLFDGLSDDIDESERALEDKEYILRKCTT
jgi:hypothetical protein